MYKRILVPTDGSPISTQAAEAALQLARACGSEIVALSVAFPDACRGGAGPMVDSLLEAAERHAAAVSTRAQAAGLPSETLATYSLSPGEAIVDAARDRQCDLIVMGSHGMRGLIGTVAGSVAQHVLAYSAIPVLMLRPPRADATVNTQAGF
jgi:nucleotide-binding universal stress UspA family protein